MIKDYICIDIENPNARGNSICSIAVIVVKDNKIYGKPKDRTEAIKYAIKMATRKTKTVSVGN